jgi:D-sedoheptulose 7-phosphate isomerase
MSDAIVKAFEDSIAAKRSFLKDNLETLNRVIDTLCTAFSRNQKLLLFGNGGSAADAQHIAAEFVNRFEIERPPLPAIALTTDSSALTSIANDYDYTEVFARQVMALGSAGDVALAISTSGNAGNVLRALAVCKEQQITTVGLTGGEGGKMASQVDHLLCVRGVTRTARVQETHILVGHVICDMVDRRLFPS